MISIERSTINNENNFAVSDTAKVNQIFIADSHGNTILLKRENKKWFINNKYEVRKDAITTILNTIQQIRIQRPVPKKAYKNVVKKLATTGVKVEIYTNKETPNKTYTIGTSTADHLGTYMLLENAKEPFIMHIPSFNGFLSPRYGIVGNSLNKDIWRSTIVFKLKPNDIRSISLKHIKKPEQSFLIKTKPLTLFNYNGENTKFNRLKVINLLNSFNSINCESFRDEIEKNRINDQLHELIINNDTLRTYANKFSINKFKDDQSNVKRMYATLNSGELMLIQDYVFNKVLININQLE